MSVNAKQIEELRLMDAATPDLGANDLAALSSIPEVIAFIVAVARAGGNDECDMAETLVRFSDLGPDTVRGAERVLRPLGYGRVADRLRQIAGRRRKSLVPLG
jgi:hypothetical protein